MASESAVKDPNNARGLLVHSPDGTETRKLKQTAGGGIAVENVTVSTVNRNIDVDESEDQVGSAGDIILTGYYISNRAGAERFIKLYEGTTATVTVGTTAPKMTIPLAAAQSANLSGLNILFTGGLVIAATTGVADNDTGAPGANEIVANVFTKAA